MSENESSMLLDEYPVLVLPSLACAVGLNEAIVLQQVHYWLKNAERNKNEFKFRHGKWWVYNSYPEWQANFPWWGIMTIRRTIASLEAKGFLVSGQLGKDRRDRTKWYTIDYDKIRQMHLTKMNTSICPNCTDGSVQNGQMLISETTSETTPETNKEAPVEIPDSLRREFVFVKTWEEFIEYRKAKKKKLSPTGASKLLVKLSQFPVATAVAMLNQSMENDWQGVFELKNGNGRHSAPPAPKQEYGDYAKDRLRRAIEAGYDPNSDEPIGPEL